MAYKNVLNINPDIVCAIISKAKEFQAKEGVSFDENIANSEYETDPLQILADHNDDLTYQEVANAINNLEPDQKIDLLALMYIGRGDFSANEWSLAHKEAKNNLQPNLTKYLLTKPAIAEFLEKGLEILGYSCSE